MDDDFAKKIVGFWLNEKILNYLKSKFWQGMGTSVILKKKAKNNILVQNFCWVLVEWKVI